MATTPKPTDRSSAPHAELVYICAAYKCETAHINATSVSSAISAYAKENPEMGQDGKVVNYKQGDCRDITVVDANGPGGYNVVVYRLTFGWNRVCDLPHVGDVIACKSCGSTSTVTYRGGS